jgi:tRNA/tmRNA/rRNA uracil-C5-methylase (TrmA/RlmC/RlmD family)
MNIYAAFLGICAPCSWSFLQGRLQQIDNVNLCECIIFLFNTYLINKISPGCKEKYHSELTGDLAICYLHKRRIVLRIKDRAIVKIDAVAFGGEGVGRIDNFVVFIPFSAPGDELEIEITQLKKKFVRGKILKIITPSTLRAEPLCRYYEKCGGCCYQHLDYEYQLFIKKKQVQEAFWKIGKIAKPPVLEVIASPKAYNYRGKAQYHSEIISNRRETGFLDVSGGELVDIESCEIMEETINEKLRVLRESKRSRNNKDS